MVIQIWDKKPHNVHRLKCSPPTRPSNYIKCICNTVSSFVLDVDGDDRIVKPCPALQVAIIIPPYQRSS